MSRSLCRSTCKSGRDERHPEKLRVRRPAFGAKMKVLQEDVEHRVDEEEKEIFKEASKSAMIASNNLASRFRNEKRNRIRGPRNQKQSSGKA